MKKTIYHIGKMDCPSEEAMIRMKLESIREIKELRFDLDKRDLTIFHTEENPEIKERLAALNLGSRKVQTVETEFTENNHKQQSSLLWAVLIINFSFFIIEMLAGLISRSMGLVADSLDMLADAFVYGLSLRAVGAAISRKKRVARLSGYFQMLLAILGIIEVGRRFIYSEINPDYQTMIIVSVFALIANAVCMVILGKTKSEEAHIKASKIFTSNDIVINIGVILAGILVMFTNSFIPDLVIGTIVFVIVVRGALRILKLG